MATERLSMRQLREILRQKLVLCRTHREVVASLAVGLGTVSEVLRRARVSGVDFAAAESLTDPTNGSFCNKAGFVSHKSKKK